MAYLEELLPEFRKGAKIRRKDWSKGSYIYLREGTIYGKDNTPVDYAMDSSWLSCSFWEFYQDPEPDWQYIIDHKCLCYFWDYNESKKHIGILKSINKYETYKFSIVTPDNYVGDISFVNCCPVRRDEVTFYEDKNNED